MEASVLSETLWLLLDSCSVEEDAAFPSATPLEGCSSMLLLWLVASECERFLLQASKLLFEMRLRLLHNTLLLLCLCVRCPVLAVCRLRLAND